MPNALHTLFQSFKSDFKGKLRLKEENYLEERYTALML